MQPGIIQSDHFPDPYNSNTSQEWHICAKTGVSVRLTFSEFSLEEEDNCGYDRLSILDGQLKPIGGRDE